MSYFIDATIKLRNTPEKEKATREYDLRIPVIDILKQADYSMNKLFEFADFDGVLNWAIKGIAVKPLFWCTGETEEGVNIILFWFKITGADAKNINEALLKEITKHFSMHVKLIEDALIKICLQLYFDNPKLN